MQCKSIVLLLLLLMATYTISAQPKLALIKNDRIITRFEEGEYIRFKRKGDKGFIRAIITGIHAGYFTVATDTIYHYNLAKVDVREKKLTEYKVASIGKGLVIAGGALVLIDIFNTLVIRGKPYEMESQVAAMSITLVGVGAFALVVNNNYFKPGRRKKVASLYL